MRPPPGPNWPGCGAPAGLVSPQHAAASVPSSKVMISKPSCLNAGEATICGTHSRRNLSAETSPPGSPFLQGALWPSWQRSGVMKEKFGVVATDCKSTGSLSRLTTCVAQVAASSMTEWKYTNGLCLSAYRSAAVAMLVTSTSPIFGCARRIGAHAFHVTLPGVTRVLQLVGQGLHIGGIHAARTANLAVGIET